MSIEIKDVNFDRIRLYEIDPKVIYTKEQLNKVSLEELIAVVTMYFAMLTDNQQILEIRRRINSPGSGVLFYESLVRTLATSLKKNEENDYKIRQALIGSMAELILILYPFIFKELQATGKV